MPAGNTSLQAYAPTNYTTMVASTYKADIDSNSSIVGNPAAALTVYPNSPAALSVLVDTGFTFVETGTGMVLQNGGGPTTVTVTAPGSNSWYVVIYYDTLANTCGATTGASGVSPTIQLPEHVRQIPLAAVLVANGQLTVVATNITDLRSWVRGPLCTSPSAYSTSGTINCFGATSVVATTSFTGAGCTVTLSNLMAGVPVFIRVANTNASTQTLKLAATSPAAVAYAILVQNSADASIDMVATGVSLLTGAARVFILNAPAVATLTGPML